MQLFIVLNLIIFFVIQTKVLLSDIRSQKIPNSLLKILLLQGIIYWGLQIYFHNFSILFAIGNVVFALGIGFFLYFLGFWSAGDGKYIIILSMFLQHHSLVNMFFNIGILTLAYIGISSLIFYIKVFVKSGPSINIYEHIKNDISAKLQKIAFSQEKAFIFTEFMKKILGLTVIFLGFFITIRLAKILIIEDIRSIFLYYSLEKYIGEILLCFFVFFFFISKYLQKIYQLFLQKIHKFLSEKKLSFNIQTTWFFLSIGTILILIICLYIIIGNSKIFFEKLSYILGIGMIFYISMKICFYTYRIYADIHEGILKNISQIQVGDIVDKNFLLEQFKNQTSSEEIWNFLKNFENPINQDTQKKLQKIFSTINKITKNKPGTQPYEYIKILHAFAFSPFIFAGFLITIVFGDTLQESIVNFLFKSISKAL